MDKKKNWVGAGAKGCVHKYIRYTPLAGAIAQHSAAEPCFGEPRVCIKALISGIIRRQIVMLNPAIKALRSPPVSVVAAWRALYDGHRGDLIGVHLSSPFPAPPNPL